MKNIKVQNMMTESGNHVANQFIIETNGRRIFKSYHSVIAIIDKNGNVSLDRKMWDYSQTTGKYRNSFLGETKAETERKIKEGVYKLKNLN